MAQQQGFTIWLTGMLGAGKTTMADYIAARLRQVGRSVEVLDEDDVKDELFDELEEVKDDRVLVTRRLGFVADLLSRNGVCTVVACCSPYKSIRDENRRLINRYLEIYVDCPTEDLIKRDNTGKYKKALHGEIPNFIGITEPYEPPGSPEVTIQSNLEPVESGGLRVFQSLLDLAYMTPEEVKIITGTKLKANPASKGKVGKGNFAAPPAKAGKPEKGGKVAKADKKPAKAAKVAPKKVEKKAKKKK